MKILLPRSRALQLLSAAVTLSLVTGCAVVRQDEVGIKRTLGRIDEEPRNPGAVLYFPGMQSVIRLFRLIYLMTRIGGLYEVPENGLASSFRPLI